MILNNMLRGPRAARIVGAVLISVAGLALVIGLSERPVAGAATDSSFTLAQADSPVSGAIEKASQPVTAESGLVLSPGVYDAQWVIPDDNDNIQYSPNLMATFPKNAAGRIKGNPKFASEQPVYGIIEPDSDARKLKTWNKASILFALDESKGTGTGYDTIYLDSNLNDDLSDEQGVLGSTGVGRDQTKWINFFRAGSVCFNKLFPGSSNANPVIIGVFVAIQNGSVTSGEAALRGCWQAELDSNRGKVLIRLVDVNGNGILNDEWSMLADGTAARGDSILLDFIGKGRFEDTYLLDRAPQYPVSSVVSIKGRLYTLKPTESGDKIELRNYDGPTGKLAFKLLPIEKAAAKPTIVCAMGKTGYYRLPIDGTDLVVPAGSYRLEKLILEIRGSDGKPSNYNLFDRRIVRVPMDNTTTVTLGGDVGLAVAPDTESVTLIRGKTSEFPVSVRLSSGGEVLLWDSGRGQGATVDLVDASGKVVQNARRGMGWGGSAMYYIKLPTDFKPGAYKIQATFDARPLGGVLKAEKQAIVE